MMNLNSDHITRIIIALFCFFAIAKILPLLISSLFDDKTHTKHKSKESLDELIEKKRRVLQAQYSSHKSSTAPIQTAAELIQEASKSKTPECQFERLQKQSIDKNDKVRADDLAKIILIKRSISWGDSPYLNTFKESYFKIFFASISKERVTKVLTPLFTEEIFEKRLHQPLPTYREVENILIYFLFLYEMFDDDLDRYSLFAKKIDLSLNILKASAVLTLADAMDLDNKELLIHFTKNPDNFSLDSVGLTQKVLIQKMPQIIHKTYPLEHLNPQLLVNKITYYGELLKKIIYIHDHVTENHNSAMKLFGITNQDDLEHLEERFRKLKKEYHPDNIARYKLPVEIEKYATQNFQKIMGAYKLLKTSIQKEF